MNKHHLLTLLTCVMLGPASCTVYLPDYLSSVGKRLQGPVAESEWNAQGLWQRVADQPPTYIPKGYPVSAPRDDDHGLWLVDARDGKRVFAPRTKVGNTTPGVLLGEARKVTSPPPMRGIYPHAEF